MADHSEATIESCLRPGERLIWSGRPDHEAGLPTRKKNPWIRPAIYLALIMAAAWYVTNELPGDTLERMLGGLKLNSSLIFGIAGVVFVMFVLPSTLRAFKLDSRSRLDRYFLSLQYAITNQRLIIMQGGTIESYGPEDLTQLKIRDRGDGRQDVEFQNRTSSDSATQDPIKDPVGWEQRHAGFKMLPDAVAVKQRIEQWIEERFDEVSEAAEDFTSGDTKSAGAFSNPRLGLVFSAPEGWDIQVRKKAQPFGAKFYDKMNWHAIGATDDWNLVRMEGPMDCCVEFELFETDKPLVSYKTMTKSFWVKAMAGKPIDSDPEYQLNGMNGFRLTYRDDLQMDKHEKGKAAGIAAVARMSRKYMLHDGQRQLYIETRWPEGSEELGEVVDKIVHSIVVQ
jgi:hypothetical protein